MALSLARTPSGLKAPRGPGIPLVGHDVLRGLYAHRLMTTAQVHEVYAPLNTLRWALATLARLERDGFVARVRVAGRKMFAWYLTPAGYAVTEGPGVEPRPYRMTPALAAGPQQAHTLAANEVGLCFVRAARQRGDDCWSEAWRNETKYDLGGRDKVIADALLEYTMVHGQSSTFLTRFVEVDRATYGAKTLVAKLESYAKLSAMPQLWRLHVSFPGVMVVMTGAPPTVLERRMDALEHHIPKSSVIGGAPGLAISVSTLERLQAEGPFAPIFWRPGVEVLVDVLGRPGPR